MLNQSSFNNKYVSKKKHCSNRRKLRPSNYHVKTDHFVTGIRTA